MWKKSQQFFLTYSQSILLIAPLLSMTVFFTGYFTSHQAHAEPQAIGAAEAEEAYEDSYKKVKVRIVSSDFYHEQAVLSRILSDLGGNGVKVDLYDSPTDQAMAFCYPDESHIFVSMQLLSKITYKDEIAFILAHELSHIQNKKHVYTINEKRAFLAALQQLAKNLRRKHQVTLVEEMTKLESRHNEEYQADEMALALIKGKYSAKGSESILKELGDKNMNRSSSTHPSIEKRLDKIKKLDNYKKNIRRDLKESDLSKGVPKYFSNEKGENNSDQAILKKAIDLMHSFKHENQNP